MVTPSRISLGPETQTASPAPSSTRSSSYALRTPPAVKVNYIHRLGTAHKRPSDPTSSAQSAKAVKRSRFDASEVIVIADDDDEVHVVSTPRQTQGAAAGEGQFEVQDLGEYTVGGIIARSLFPGYGPDGRKEYQYLVRWAGYGPADDTWEMETSLRESVDTLIRAFDRSPRPWSIRRSRSENKQRQYLVRFAPPGDTTPHAEEVWLTRWAMQTHGMTDADKRIQTWSRGQGQDRKLFAKGAGSGLKRAASQISISSSPSTYAASPKKLKIASPSKSQASTAPTSILLEVLDVIKYPRKNNQKKKAEEFQISYRTDGADSAIQQAVWYRSKLHSRFGAERVNEALATYWAKVKADEAAVAEEREAVRQAQQENEYEIERQRRIQENMAMMRELGLGLAS